MGSPPLDRFVSHLHPYQLNPFQLRPFSRLPLVRWYVNLWHSGRGAGKLEIKVPPVRCQIQYPVSSGQQRIHVPDWPLRRVNQPLAPMEMDVFIGWSSFVRVVWSPIGMSIRVWVFRGHGRRKQTEGTDKKSTLIYYRDKVSTRESLANRWTVTTRHVSRGRHSGSDTKRIYFVRSLSFTQSGAV